MFFCWKLYLIIRGVLEAYHLQHHCYIAELYHLGLSSSGLSLLSPRMDGDNESYCVTRRVAMNMEQLGKLAYLFSYHKLCYFRSLKLQIFRDDNATG